MGRSSASSSKMALWAILLAASPLLASAGDAQYGFDMVRKAGRGACWAEKLNKLPPIDEQGVSYGLCYINVGYRENEMEIQIKGQPAGTKVDAELMEGIANALKPGLKSKLKENLPSVYASTCGKFVDDEKKKPAKDYSSILQDSSQGDYPFRGLAHCLLETIEQTNGAAALSALNSHWRSPKSFEQAIIDRENENRARHGVSPLTLDSELSTRAQRYAEENARECRSEHMSHIYKDGHPDLVFNGKPTGENLAAYGSLKPTDNERGVDAANGWYTESLAYPWPYYDGTNAKLKDIGHFTQSVWKSTKLAGYGVARNEACPEFKIYIVARFFPGGNYKGKYKDNVMPAL